MFASCVGQGFALGGLLVLLLGLLLVRVWVVEEASADGEHDGSSQYERDFVKCGASVAVSVDSSVVMDAFLSKWVGRTNLRDGGVRASEGKNKQ